MERGRREAAELHCCEVGRPEGEEEEAEYEG